MRLRFWCQMLFRVPNTQFACSVALANHDRSSMLLFSGGVTRPEYPTQSEAQSYLELALGSFQQDDSWRARAFTEDYALDSFQNLFFSIMRFHELAIAVGNTGRASWPTKITVVGFEMKQRRFVELHRHALRWPEDKFEYVGVDLLDPTERAKSWQGEVSSRLNAPRTVCNNRSTPHSFH